MIENVAAAPLRHRPSPLLTALGFALLRAPEPVPPVIAELRRWLDTWKGIGLIAGGMARQGYDLSLTRYDERGWRATFYVNGMEHSATGATGVGIRADAGAGEHSGRRGRRCGLDDRATEGRMWPGLEAHAAAG